MKTEIMQKIIDKQDELIKISDELTTVGSSLSSLQDSAMFGDRFNKLSNEQDYLYEKYREIKSDIASLKSQLAEAGEEKKQERMCLNCAFGYKPTLTKPCVTCDIKIHSNWQPR